MEEKYNFRRFGTMLDCSRNAVPTVDSLKKWIDITTELGYNTLLLYMEDTYEVDDNPYFGYMRGRYSQEELCNVDYYAQSKGMELIPCIQTLAHLDTIKRWPAYAPCMDIDDILLAGDERVYQLIDRMFASISRCFASRIVNIGMDEAHMVGRGKYYDLHGDSDRTQVLLDHLNRVSAIGQKYGLTLIMWSDMFFRLVSGGEYYNSHARVNEEVEKQIPQNVQLIYWDYYSTDLRHYDEMLHTHKKIKDDTWFAGGLWTWMGFAPHNGYSIQASTAALKSCRKQKVRDVFLTLWGDNGGECSIFSAIPSLFYAAEVAKGITDKTRIKREFRKRFGVSFDKFMLLDLPGTPGGNVDEHFNSEKYLLYNDCFTGLFNSTLAGGENDQYARCAVQLGRMKNHPEWGYLFATEQALCEVLSIKAELGERTRHVYEIRDREELNALISDYKKLLKKLKIFYRAYRTQWYMDNKSFGFDVQDVRLGGLMNRVQSCMERLQELYDGRIREIPELEEQPLDLCGNRENFQHSPCNYNSWEGMVTTNVL